MEDINSIMNNSKNMYYGHGTGTDSLEVINSIFNNGLRCSHNSLYYTSCTFGIGKQIEDDVKQILKNWPHRDSNKIIIISLPIEFHILASPSIGTYDKETAAYYYVPDENRRRQYHLTNSNYVMPEFVFGYYDALTNKFYKNLRYYELLPESIQTKLFDKVKNNYIEILENGCGIIEYKKIIEDLGERWTFPLSDDDIEKYSKTDDYNSKINR